MPESYLKFLHMLRREWRSGLLEKCRTPTEFVKSDIIHFVFKVIKKFHIVVTKYSKTETER